MKCSKSIYCSKKRLGKLTLVISLLAILINSAVIAKVPELETTEPYLMKRAIPVWAEGREREMNLTLGFRGIFKAKKNQNYILKIAAYTLYRVYLNGEFLGYGPARASHGYFRVDEYDLSKRVIKGENIVAIEVAGYNVNGYYIMNQPSFLQAEIESGEKIVLATGSDPGFETFQVKERLQKVERYSTQRAFTEYYRLKKGFDQWKKVNDILVESLKLTKLPPVKLLPRNLPLPEFDVVRPVSVYSHGKIKYIKPETYIRHASLTGINDKNLRKGFIEAELDVIPSLTVQEITNIMQDTIAKPFSVNNNISLAENEFSTFDFGIDLSGFIGAKISCTKPSRVFFYFDEILTDGDVNSKKRMPAVNNLVTYELEPGIYNLESFESYTFKYLKIIVLKGDCQIDDVYLREYAYPENRKASFNSSNIKLNDIYNAARQTLRQTTVDAFMDCPSRERGAWLADSYFIAIMEKDFTGHSAVARNFFENYALPERFANIPEGMIPMCYPADQYHGLFIPNFAIWFILQVNDYARRGGDPLLIARLKPRIEGILNYFSGFENEDGLLENLKSWIFIEWSKANSFVQDVNYPINMLYSTALSDAADLYHNDKWRQKSERIRQTVLKQSFNGTFFVDNAVRNKDGKLEITTNTTEVCQYYAFYFNLATPETNPALWKKLTTEFGPTRNFTITYPEVFPTNAYIGNYIRMDILSRYGLKNQLLKEMQDYFHYMAQRTGTLWEKMEDQASCIHGYASYMGHVLYRDALGVSKIDYIGKEATISFSDIDLEECNGVIPIDDSSIELNWKRSGNQIRYSVRVPIDYKLKVENLSSSELVKLEME